MGQDGDENSFPLSSFSGGLFVTVHEGRGKKKKTIKREGKRREDTKTRGMKENADESWTE